MANPIFNKNLGQHILNNTKIIDSLIQKANIKPTDIILEIGGGTGNLTIKLLEKAKKVICYEKDPRLANELLQRVKKNENHYRKLELIVGDALKHDFQYFDLCISNTPYEISAPLTFKLLKYKFRAAFLMFQKEFADRILAQPGNKEYSRLSVAIQILAKTEHVMKVNKNSFKPPPKVESSIVKIEPKTIKPTFDLKEYNNLLKICFHRKNKTLSAITKENGIKKTILSCNKKINDQELELKVSNILIKSHYNTSRAAKMNIDDFTKLFMEFKKENISFK